MPAWQWCNGMRLDRGQKTWAHTKNAQEIAIYIIAIVYFCISSWLGRVGKDVSECSFQRGSLTSTSFSFAQCAHLIHPFIDRICFGQVSLNPIHSNSPHTSFYELRLLQASAQTDFNSWRSSPFGKLIKRGGESVPRRKTELKPREGWLYKIYWVDPNILPSHLMKENEVREYTPRFYNFKHFRSSFVFR